MLRESFGSPWMIQSRMATGSPSVDDNEKLQLQVMSLDWRILDHDCIIACLYDPVNGPSRAIEPLLNKISPVTL